MRRGDSDGHELTRVFVRPIANPLPLGVFSFGIGTLLLSLNQIGTIPQSEAQTVAIFILAAVFPVQAVAALVSVLARDTPGFDLLRGSRARGWRSGSTSWSHRRAPRARPSACSCSRSVAPCCSAASRSSIAGGTHEQLERLRHAPGVRAQL